jgi:hypothetical protein
VYACASVPATFVAVTVKVGVPTVVGVPLMTPEVALSASPAGSVPALTLNVGAGEPLALITCE